MTVESLAIIALILVMAWIFIRTRKKAVAILTLPLISVPIFYLPSSGIYRITGISAFPFQTFALCMVFAGSAVGLGICALLSRMVPTRRGKTGYMCFCLIFQIAIAIGYMINII